MSDGQLKSLIERILHLHAEEDEIKADRREVYAEAKAAGYDKTALGAAVSILRKREKDAEGFAERNAIVDLYLEAYSGPSHAYAHAREAEQDADPGVLTAAQSEGAAGAIPGKEGPDCAAGEGNGHSTAQGLAFVTQLGAGEGRSTRPDDPAPAADVRPIAKPKAAEIDLTIPAFLDRRIPKPEARQ